MPTKREPWTTDDQHEAESEGWALFNLESDPIIQKDDDYTAFYYDDDALLFVAHRAIEGSELHQRALLLHFGVAEYEWPEPTEQQISDASNYAAEPPMSYLDKDTLGRGGLR